MNKKAQAIEPHVASIRNALSAKNGGSVFNAKTECFTATVENNEGKPKTVRLKGLVPSLKETLYPDFVFTRPEQGGTERAPIVGGSIRKRKGTMGAGMARGKAVDSAIARAVATGNFTPQCRATRHIFAALLKMGLTPAMTQAPVHGLSKGVRVGTAIDLICFNASLQPVIVEIKTGYSNTWDVSNGSMRAPLRSMSNCPKHQHMLQLALTCEFFTMTTGMRVADAFVLRVIASGVDYTRVSPEIRRSVPTLLKLLQKQYHE
jgi:hypothetical protein